MMKITTLISVLIFSVLFTVSSVAQSNTPQTYTGAKAKLKKYKAAYQLNSDDDSKIKATLKNMQNSLNDPRLKGKLQLELVVHGGGVKVFMNDGVYEKQLKELQQQGVILAQCLNTMQERNISKEQLYSFISFVPSGNGELVILQQQGWAIIHP